MNKIDIQPIPEMEADARTLCEIRFDCLVRMHDLGFKSTQGGLFGVGAKDLPPQWFRSRLEITLEDIKYQSAEALGMQIKQMYHKLQQTIEKYEQFR